MLKMIVDRHIIYVLMGVFCTAGALGKCITNVSLNRLVRGAGTMSKSTHPLMRLVRAKFEHACMVSEKVENVRAFVDKYLYEYRVLRIRLHSWRRLELMAAGICVVLGGAGAFAEYVTYGMQDEVLKIGAAGAILGILLYLFHLSTDENYRLEAARNYMVDYLENVCLHRYEKAYQKELKVMTTDAGSGEYESSENLADDEIQEDALKQQKEHLQERADTYVSEILADDRVRITPAKAVRDRTAMSLQRQRLDISQHPDMAQRPEVEIPSPQTPSEIDPVEKPKPSPEPEVKEPIRSRDVLIRQILEEFMA